MKPPPSSTSGSVVVAGGTGFVGRIIVQGLLAASRDVVVPSRSEASLAALSGLCQGLPGRLIMIKTESEEQSGDLAEKVRNVVPDVRAVVAALGGWEIGPELIDVDVDAWQSRIANNLTSHLIAMQAYAPLLIGQVDPVYITFNGAAAYQAMPGSGPICITGAAQRMLTEIMRAEAIGKSVRFHEIALMEAVAGDSRNLLPRVEIGPDQIHDAVLRTIEDSTTPAFSKIWGSADLPSSAVASPRR